MELHSIEIESPIGGIVAVTHGARLCAVDFTDLGERTPRLLARRFGAVDLRPARSGGDVARRLRDYFAGDLTAFEGIEVETPGTPFQQEVWSALRRIPAATTTTYAAIARAVGRPESVRAVGAANGANLVALVIPCHRVIGSDGSLTGYASGVDRKRWLLDHERKNAA